MTICPFMSRPESDSDGWALARVECLREECAAWGPVEPLWTVDREGDNWYVTWYEGKWQRIPRKEGHDLILCGCRRLGFEVPE